MLQSLQEARAEPACAPIHQHCATSREGSRFCAPTMAGVRNFIPCTCFLTEARKSAPCKCSSQEEGRHTRYPCCRLGPSQIIQHAMGFRCCFSCWPNMQQILQSNGKCLLSCAVCSTEKGLHIEQARLHLSPRSQQSKHSQNTAVWISCSQARPRVLASRP